MPPTPKRSDRPVENLKYYLALSDRILALIPFLAILIYKLGINLDYDWFTLDGYTQAFADFQDNWQDFIWPNARILILSVVVYRWFRNYRFAVHNEAEILTTLYTGDREPHDWHKVTGRRFVPFLMAGFLAVFLLLAWFVDNLTLFCLLMLGLWTQDMLGNTILRRNLQRYFKDARLRPTPTDPMEKIVVRRREAADEYWINKPNSERIALMVFLTCGALLMTLSEVQFGVAVNDWIITLFICAIILGNEWIMVRWRRERDAILDETEVERSRLAAQNTLATDTAQD